MRHRNGTIRNENAPWSTARPGLQISSFAKVLLLACFIVAFSCERSAKKVIGIKIYHYDGDVQSLTQKWKDIGINTAFVSEELAANTSFREVLREKSIPVYMIFPVFFNPRELASDSTLYAVTDRGTIARDGWVRFVCPSREEYRARRVATVKELVKDLDPDGISLDFIRQFVFWEKIFEDRASESIARACYCSHCVADFSRKTGIILPDTLSSVAQKAHHLTRYHDAAWNRYRVELITSMAEEIVREVKEIKPAIRICVHAVPWRSTDFDGAGTRVAAQDLESLSGVADYISPMCYTGMLRRKPQWVSSVVADMNSRASGKLLPSIQVYDQADSASLDREEFEACVREALAPPSQGVVFWSWDLFVKDSARIEIAKAAVANH